MAKSKVAHKLIQDEEKEMAELQAPSESDIAEQYDERKFDQEFWLKVKDKVKSGLSWHKAMDERRAERLIEDDRIDPLYRIIYWWPKLKKYEQKSKFNHSLEYLISRLAEIILERDKEQKYRLFAVEDIKTEPTLLHLAAEQNFLYVSRCLVERYPELLYQMAEDEYESLPVEFALRKRNDDTAAYLISQMQYDRVEGLFLSADNVQKPKFYFGDIISSGNSRTNENCMKKTVLAVLNKLINPHWPYVPDRPDGTADKEDIDKALESVPDDPMKYDFKYHILEADENGRRPKIKVKDKSDPMKTKWTKNTKFNHQSMSCLQLIADSKNKELVQHPVVRMLVLKKWNNSIFNRFCVRAAIYVLFLLLLSLALVYGATRDDPSKYDGRADNFRAFCEIISIIILMVQLLDEISEVAREGRIYFEVWHNYLDILGIILTLLVVPLRLSDAKSQWGFAALGYIFNFLRLYKYSNISRTMGLYTTTLVRIIREDITRFMIFFSVIFIGFCGAMEMALKMNDMQGYFGEFKWLMLAEFRALIEQQSLEESYKKFGWLTIIILLTYMGVVIVILLNVLIAQLSYTYSEAKKIAKLQYAANLIKIVTRIEYSRFKCLSLREKLYEEGEWFNDEQLAQEFLEYAEERHPWETVEERIVCVREIMRKVVRKDKERDPMENMSEKLAGLIEPSLERAERIRTILLHWLYRDLGLNIGESRTVQNPPEKSPSLDSIEFKNGVKSFPEQGVILPTTTDGDVSCLISELPEVGQSTLWKDIWDDSLSNYDFD